MSEMSERVILLLLLSSLSLALGLPAYRDLRFDENLSHQPWRCNQLQLKTIAVGSRLISDQIPSLFGPFRILSPGAIKHSRGPTLSRDITKASDMP